MECNSTCKRENKCKLSVIEQWTGNQREHVYQMISQHNDAIRSLLTYKPCRDQELQRVVKQRMQVSDNQGCFTKWNRHRQGCFSTLTTGNASRNGGTSASLLQGPSQNVYRIDGTQKQNTQVTLIIIVYFSNLHSGSNAKCVQDT